MILHDFVYEWDGKSHDGKKPIAWWPGAYHVRIIRLDAPETGMSYLVPTAVILKNAHAQNEMKNTSLRNYIHTFAEKISQTYSLDMAQTLWVELDDTIRVTRLSSESRVVSPAMFDIDWREIRPNELKMIEPYINDLI